MPQATQEQQVDEDLPPWQHEPLPDLAAYEADDWPVENEPADTFEYASESGLSDVEPLVEIEPERQELEPSTETSLPTEQDSGNLSSSVSASTDVYLEKKSWWEQLIDTLGFDALKRQLALDCILQPVGDGYQLLVPERTKHLATESNLQELTSRIHGYVGLNTPIELVFQSELVDETPRQAQDRRTEERQQHAVQSIINDPVVKELQQLFDATLDQDTIKPS